MKTIVAALRAANLSAKPRAVACTGTGQWLHWQTPDGNAELIGVAIALSGITHCQIATARDIHSATARHWGEATAQQLGTLLDMASTAIIAGTPLPDGISAEPIPIVNGDTPAGLLDILWQAGPAKSPLLQKKTAQQR